MADQLTGKRVDLNHGFGRLWLCAGAEAGSAKPAGVASPGEVIAKTLNKMPISAGSIKRCCAAATAAAWCGLLAANRLARVGKPRTVKKARWLIGPWAVAPPPVAVAANAAKSTWAVRSAAPGVVRGSTG